MSDEKTGLKTAIAELHDQNAPPPGVDDGEQLPLLPLPLEGNAEKNMHPLVRGRGRPPGAKNKNTEAWRDFVLSQYRSPLEALAQTYSSDVASLSERLSCTKLEAFKMQILAAKELAPYLHQKQPLAIDAGAGGLIQLHLYGGAAQAAGVDDAPAITLQVLDEKDEENQMVVDADFQDCNASDCNGEGQDDEITG